MPDSTQDVEMDDPCQYNESKILHVNWFEYNKNQFCKNDRMKNKVLKKLDKTQSFLIVYGQFNFNGYRGLKVSQINYTATLFGLTQDQQVNEKLIQKFIIRRSHSITANCHTNLNEQQQDEVYQGNRLLSRIDNYSSQKNVSHYDDDKYEPLICNLSPLIYIPQLEYNDYLLVISYSKFLPEIPNMEIKFNLTAKTFYPIYIQTVLIVRYSFFVISIIAFALFARRIFQLNQKQLEIEQDFVMRLSFFLIFFNDPFYGITLLVPNKITPILGILFFSNFICYLFLYWLVSYNRFVIENWIQFSTAELTKFKIIVTVLLWICFVICQLMLFLYYSENPTINSDDQLFKAFQIFKILSYVFSFCIFLNLFLYIIKFYICTNNRLWRFKLVGLFNIIFIISQGYFIFSGSFEIYILTGTEALICISLLNIYIYYQQFLWSPWKEGIIQQNNDYVNQNDNEIELRQIRQ